MTIKKTIKDITQMIMKITQMTIDRFNKPDIREAYIKMVSIIMKCKTEEQLNNAGRCLRNYERLVQNSHLYPNITRAFRRRTVNDLSSLIRLKRKEYRDF